MHHKSIYIFGCSFFLLFLPAFVGAQIDAELGIERKRMSAFDSLLQDISVPEIDPRQYVIIYEWEPSNEKKGRKAIRDKHQMKELERKSELVRMHQRELHQKKKALENRVREEMDSINTVISNLSEEVLTEKEKIPDNYQERLAELNELYYNSDVSTEEDSLFSLLNEWRTRHSNSQERIYYLEREIEELKSGGTKNCPSITSLTLLKEEMQRFESVLRENKYKSGYLQWYYGKGKDSTRFNSFRPFDFFDDTDVPYKGLYENYREYYNEVVWRNAGTPDWEPIWWLNQYPWPNLDYRNIDLLDQDYRDGSFALIPYQKYDVIDDNAILRIVFDKTQLARNENFQGAIGIKASLNDGPYKQGANDEREIEVNPYSVIGKARKAIGLLNRPAGELADNLIILIIKAQEVSKEAERITVGTAPLSTNQERRDLLERLKDLIGESQKLFQVDSLPQNAQQINNLIASMCQLSDTQPYSTVIDNTPYFSEYCNVGKAYDPENVDRDLETQLNLLLRQIERDLRGSVKVVKYADALNFRENLRPISTYLNYFSAEVGNTRDAFLNLVGKDKISFDYLNDRFNIQIRQLDSTLILMKQVEETGDSTRRSTVNKDIISSIEELQRLMNRFADVQGSPIAYAIKTLNNTNGDEIRGEELANEADYHLLEGNESLLKILGEVFRNNRARQQLREYIAEKAGEILYQDLVFGTIDLDKADAQDGDMLTIELYWDKEAVKNQDPGKAVSSGSGEAENANQNATASPQRDGVALYIAKFRIMDRGWRRSTPSQTVMINRINEDRLRANYPLSPSNFKPSGGVSLLWTLHNDYRIEKKIRFDPATDRPQFYRNGQLKYNRLEVFLQKTAKWLEPSLGASFHYLDYDTTEILEIGVGPTVGLFDNVLTFTGGWNLMELNERPFYFGLGVSILNLAAKVTQPEPYRK